MMGMFHTATFRDRRQNFALAYDGGTAVFTVGKTLTGATSHATAVIVSTGAAASGTLILHTVTGTFLNDEAITDNNGTPGAAVVNGSIAEAFDSNNEVMYTNVDTTVPCKFYNQKIVSKTSGQTPYFTSSPRIMLPASVTPSTGDQVISSNVGFIGTWIIGTPDPKAGPGGILHHWECDIAKAGA